MLRLLVALLLLANLVCWAVTRDEVAQALGLGSDADREPARMARQIHPEAVRLLRSEGAVPRSSSASAGASSAPELGSSCLESGPLSETELPLATRELQQAGVPTGAWVDMRRELPGRWLLLMGRFADREQAQRKAIELQHMSLPYEELLDVPELSPGLVLGRFGSDAEAQARLTQLRGRGVRTARVVQLSPARVEHRLRVDRLAPERRAQLQALAASGAASGPASSPASARAGTNSAATRWSACSAPP